jgi:type IV pilus assembly protein PilX
MSSGQAAALRGIRRGPARPPAQRGFILVTALILLVVLTMLALSAFGLIGTQTKVAANSASQQLTFQAAEGALQQAQTNLLGGSYTPAQFAANSAGLYVYNPSNAAPWTTVNWASSSAVMSSNSWATSLPSSISAAYMIEMMPPVVIPGQNFANPASVYRITAYATQASGGAPVMLQSLVQIQQ